MIEKGTVFRGEFLPFEGRFRWDDGPFLPITELLADRHKNTLTMTLQFPLDSDVARKMYEEWEAGSDTDKLHSPDEYDQFSETPKTHKPA